MSKKTDKIKAELIRMVSTGQIPSEIKEGAETLIELLTSKKKDGFKAAKYLNGDPEHDLALLNTQAIAEAMGGVDLDEVYRVLTLAAQVIGGIVKLFI